MNYDKKRKRQNGRQAKRKPQYKIWIDEYAQIHATIEKEIKDGILPAVSFDPATIKWHYGDLQS